MTGFSVQGHLEAKGEYFCCFRKVSWGMGLMAGEKGDGEREE